MTLKIDVTDTGIGIPEEDKDKMFKLFGFLEDKKQLNTKGIGLGLIISQQIVNKFNGKVSFTSSEGFGSVFTFTFELENELTMIDGYN